MLPFRFSLFTSNLLLSRVSRDEDVGLLKRHHPTEGSTPAAVPPITGSKGVENYEPRRHGLLPHKRIKRMGSWVPVTLATA